jgi:hypothetical protein
MRWNLRKGLYCGGCWQLTEIVLKLEMGSAIPTALEIDVRTGETITLRCCDREEHPPEREQNCSDAAPVRANPFSMSVSACRARVSEANWILTKATS